MGYPSEWLASTDPQVENGRATFKIDGVDYCLVLDSFDDFLMIGKMLDAVFQQGKTFAAQGIRSHIERALDDAEQRHAL